MTRILVGFTFLEAGRVIVEAAKTMTDNDPNCPMTHLLVAFRASCPILLDFMTDTFFAVLIIVNLPTFYTS